MKQALLIIDVQQELVEGKHEEKSVFDKERLLKHINLVINKALESEALIIFVRDKDVAEGNSPGFEIHPKVNVHIQQQSLIKKLLIRFTEHHY